MREIRIEIDEGGKVRILYQGFAGEACFEEARRLYALLKAQGLDVTIEQVTPTQEYYTSAQARAKVMSGGQG